MFFMWKSDGSAAQCLTATTKAMASSRALQKQIGKHAESIAAADRSRHLRRHDYRESSEDSKRPIVPPGEAHKVV